MSVDISWTPIKKDSEEESHDEEEDVKVVPDPLRTLSFSKKMKRLSLHCVPLKERMKDRPIRYVDLFPLDPLPPRSDEDPMPQESRRLVL